MERLRCAHCRNPIRHVGVAGPIARDDAWYHPDCWEETASRWQEDYRHRIRTGGLEALLAPYVMAAPVSFAGRAGAALAAEPQARA